MNETPRTRVVKDHQLVWTFVCVVSLLCKTEDVASFETKHELAREIVKTRVVVSSWWVSAHVVASLSRSEHYRSSINLCCHCPNGIGGSWMNCFADFSYLFWSHRITWSRESKWMVVVASASTLNGLGGKKRIHQALSPTLHWSILSSPWKVKGLSSRRDIFVIIICSWRWTVYTFQLCIKKARSTN